MNRNTLSLTGVVAAMAMSMISPAALATAPKDYKISTPIVDMNSPCTKYYDSIDGTLDIKHKLKVYGDKKVLTLDAYGHATDAYGVYYSIKEKISVKINDYYPSYVFLKADLTKKHKNGNGYPENGSSENGSSENGYGEEEYGEGGHYENDHHDKKYGKGHHGKPLLDAIVHINEHGYVTYVAVKGIECKA